MSRFRIMDAYKPGYNRTPVDGVGKVAPPGSAGTVGSQVMNQAQAAILNAASVAVPPVPPGPYRYYRLTMSMDALSNELDWNEVQFFSGADGGGSQLAVTASANPAPVFPASVLTNGATAESVSANNYTGWNNPIIGNYFQFDLGSVQPVGSIVLYQVVVLDYRVTALHIDASVDGIVWRRAQDNIAVPQQHVVTFNL
jgi:hypothetical protein